MNKSTFGYKLRFVWLKNMLIFRYETKSQESTNKRLFNSLRGNFSESTTKLILKTLDENMKINLAAANEISVAEIKGLSKNESVFLIYLILLNNNQLFFEVANWIGRYLGVQVKPSIQQIWAKISLKFGEFQGIKRDMLNILSTMKNLDLISIDGISIASQSTRKITWGENSFKVTNKKLLNVFMELVLVNNPHTAFRLDDLEREPYMGAFQFEITEGVVDKTKFNVIKRDSIRSYSPELVIQSRTQEVENK